MLRGFPFPRFEITRHIVSGYWSAGNGHQNVLHVGKRQALERPKHPVLVTGLEVIPMSASLPDRGGSQPPWLPILQAPIETTTGMASHLGGFGAKGFTIMRLMAY
jgi:hypothetical protein